MTMGDVIGDDAEDKNIETAFTGHMNIGTFTRTCPCMITFGLQQCLSMYRANMTLSSKYDVEERSGNG
jgi:hypothetical protein